MDRNRNDTAFVGSVPQIYNQYMVPLIFEHYAADLARRSVERRPTRILEIAAGTGALTRHLVQLLPPETTIVATDLNQAMLDQAAAVGTDRPVEWQQADAMKLPFPDASFDLVVCQFGAMFFPDKAKAYAEVRRVLEPGGAFLFNTWDRIEENEFADVVLQALAIRFPEDPPRFMERTPHGYFDQVAIVRDLVDGGFTSPPAVTVHSARSLADSARTAAFAYCQGTPIRGEIEFRAPGELSDITDLAEAALANRFGAGAVDGKIQALIVEVQS